MQRTKNNKFRIYSVEVFHTMYNKAFLKRNIKV